MGVVSLILEGLILGSVWACFLLASALVGRRKRRGERAPAETGFGEAPETEERREADLTEGVMNLMTYSVEKKERK